MSKSGTAAAIPAGCKFLLGLAAAQILTGTGVDLDALTLLDKDRNLNNSTGLNGSGLEYVSSSVALNARLGLSDLELNEQRRLNCENAALVGKNLNVLVLLHEAEIIAQSILANRNLLVGLVVHEVVQVAFIVQILHLAALYESLLELIAPNVSQLATEIQTSRATVMNYIKYLADARLINMVYPKGEEFPKKPSKLMMHNTNLMYSIYPVKVEEQDVLDTFFMNTLYKDHKLYKGDKGTSFMVDNGLHFRICAEGCKFKNNPNVYYALHKLELGHGNMIPLWLFGFLY